MRKTTTAILCLLALWATACQQAPEGMKGEDISQYLDASEEDMELDSPRTAEPPAPPPHEGNGPATDTSPKIIRTAEIRMEVGKVEAVAATLRGQFAALGVSVANETEVKNDYRQEVGFVLRVPPTRFDTLIGLIIAQARHLDQKDIRAEDVTRQYLDLETRLDSKRAVVTRYREILRQANTVKDILAVEEELRKVVEEIEAAEGELRYLRDRVRHSTIRLTVYETTNRTAPQRRGFGGRVADALADGWSMLQGLLIGLVGLWPLVLLVAGVVFWWRRRRK